MSRQDPPMERAVRSGSNPRRSRGVVGSKGRRNPGVASHPETHRTVVAQPRRENKRKAAAPRGFTCAKERTWDPKEREVEGHVNLCV